MIISNSLTDTNDISLLKQVDEIKSTWITTSFFGARKRIRINVSDDCTLKVNIVAQNAFAHWVSWLLKKISFGYLKNFWIYPIREFSVPFDQQGLGGNFRSDLVNHVKAVLAEIKTKPQIEAIIDNENILIDELKKILNRIIPIVPPPAPKEMTNETLRIKQIPIVEEIKPVVLAVPQEPPQLVPVSLPAAQEIVLIKEPEIVQPPQPPLHVESPKHIEVFKPSKVISSKQLYIAGIAGTVSLVVLGAMVWAARRLLMDTPDQPVLDEMNDQQILNANSSSMEAEPLPFCTLIEAPRGLVPIVDIVQSNRTTMSGFEKKLDKISNKWLDKLPKEIVRGRCSHPIPTNYVYSRRDSKMSVDVKADVVKGTGTKRDAGTGLGTGTKMDFGMGRGKGTVLLAKIAEKFGMNLQSTRENALIPFQSQKTEEPSSSNSEIISFFEESPYWTRMDKDVVLEPSRSQKTLSEEICSSNETPLDYDFQDLSERPRSALEALGQWVKDHWVYTGLGGTFGCMGVWKACQDPIEYPDVPVSTSPDDVAAAAPASSSESVSTSPTAQPSAAPEETPDDADEDSEEEKFEEKKVSSPSPDKSKSSLPSNDEHLPDSGESKEKETKSPELTEEDFLNDKKKMIKKAKSSQEIEEVDVTAHFNKFEELCKTFEVSLSELDGIKKDLISRDETFEITDYFKYIEPVDSYVKYSKIYMEPLYDLFNSEEPILSEQLKNIPPNLNFSDYYAKEIQKFVKAGLKLIENLNKEKRSGS